MRALLVIMIIGCFAFSCKANYNGKSNADEIANAEKFSDTVKIAGEETEYEIIIVEPGFNAWLRSTARQEGYYSQNFLETRNRQYVLFWNQRVLQPNRFDPNLYCLQIDYDSTIDYGYDVNYKLYNYFVYFQLKYKQQLGTWIPRI
ncbi:DUF6146 family protein [Winogradskyella sp. 3972H.M.0a.05]|uniref:DUF6146 family protein n=1 Tax=Winogradskyella sp. 3972H.M.0a.05 TaxID=2950277 RepID=UPI00339AFCA7